jgi:hypothetical protein
MHPEVLQTWMFIITIVAISLLFFGYVCWLIGKQVAKSREYSHIEKIKSLEMGEPVGPSVAEICHQSYSTGSQRFDWAERYAASRMQLTT